MKAFLALAAVAGTVVLAVTGGEQGPGSAAAQDSRCAPDAAVSYVKSGTTYTGYIQSVTPAGRAQVQRTAPTTTQEGVLCSALTFAASGLTGPTEPPPTTALTNGCTSSVTVLTASTTGKLFKGCQVIIRGNGLTISGNKFEGTGRAATYSPPDVQVHIDRVTGLTFTGNELTANNMHALLYANGSSGVYVSRNDFHDTGTLDPAKANQSHAIYFDGCAACRIVNNRIERVTSYGVQLGDDGATDTLIDNNVIAEAGQGGVMLWGNTARTTITANWFTGNRYAVTSYQLTGAGNSVTAPNYATGTGATLNGTGYVKGALTLSAPPSTWTVPPQVRLG